MATLLLQLKGPMQSWGVASNFNIRDTMKEPSKSGVIGLIAAAMGLKRDADLSDLRELRFGVRSDCKGIMLKDFHTAKGVLNAEGSVLKNAVISNRYYLADACFLVGFEGKRSILEKIYNALKSPKWFLFLGRKAFPPSLPLWFPEQVESIIDRDLETALTEFPWLGLKLKPKEQDPPDSRKEKETKIFNVLMVETHEDRKVKLPDKIRLTIETLEGYASIQDQPIDYETRTFLRRKVVSRLIDLPEKSLVITEEKNVPV